MEKAGSLADLGDWPGAKIDRRSRKVIRHAYDQVLSACARLASFASGSPTTTSGPIDERQEALAVDDLVDFAIHARRLIENTAKRQRFGQVVIRSRSKSGPSELRLLAIVNTLIHHQDIEIVRTEWKAERLAGVRRSIDDFLTLPNRSFPPLVSVKSDQGKFIMFDLRELVETFQQQVLEPIVDLCNEHGFLLDDFLMDN